MEAGGPQGDDRQYLQRKDDFFDVVGIPNNEPWGAVDAFRKQSEDDHSSKQHQSELGLGFTAAAPASLEHGAEHEGVNGQHEYGVEERPEDAEEGTPLATDYSRFVRATSKLQLRRRLTLIALGLVEKCCIS
jgi:hypothetical protein